MQQRVKFLVLLVIVLSSYAVFCQENNHQLHGKIKNVNNDVSNILIVNLNSKNSTITDSLGLFAIEVRVRDSLRFSAVQYLTKDIIVTDSILNEELIVIGLVENIIDLNEVTVTPYNLSGKIDLDIQGLGIKPAVTSSTLGLPNSDVVKMTQSERLLLEADRGKYVRLQTTEDYGKVIQILGYATVSIIVNTHKIMNRVSGRTKSLEEMVARDESMALEKEITDKFSRESISESFKIPLQEIDGFLTFCLAQNDFSELLQAQNSVIIWEYLQVKSVEFKQTVLLKDK